jgi:hypothetical protein
MKIVSAAVNKKSLQDLPLLACLLVGLVVKAFQELKECSGQCIARLYITNPFQGLTARVTPWLFIGINHLYLPILDRQAFNS